MECRNRHCPRQYQQPHPSHFTQAQQPILLSSSCFVSLLFSALRVFYVCMLFNFPSILSMLSIQLPSHHQQPFRTLFLPTCQVLCSFLPVCVSNFGRYPMVSPRYSFSILPSSPQSSIAPVSRLVLSCGLLPCPVPYRTFCYEARVVGPTIWWTTSWHFNTIANHPTCSNFINLPNSANSR